MERAVDPPVMRPRARLLVRFAVHQLVATLVVMVAAPIVLAVIGPALRVFGVSFYMRQFHWILTETPYFPVQIVFALILGYFLCCYIGDRSMLWVWILPLAFLAWAFATNTNGLSLGGVSGPGGRFAHFFGWGCQPANHCLDQLVVTLPFYTSVAYAIGAFLARWRRSGGPGTGTSVKGAA